MKTPLKRIPLAFLIRAWSKKLKTNEIRGTFNEELYLKIRLNKKHGNILNLWFGRVFFRLPLNSIFPF